MISHHTPNATAHRAAAVRSAAKAISYAASPTFALMALVTQVHGSTPDMMGMPMASPTGMTAMYLLMSVFHASPWLNLLARQVGTA
jgi:isocitrate/isopropylmalate dehydrogenase